MLDNILIVLILLSIILSFFIVKVWKKKYFVKELYIGGGGYQYFTWRSVHRLIQMGYLAII